jgi:hypothetical protein
MGNIMGIESRPGRREVATGVSIGKALGMVMGFTGFTLEMSIRGSGLMGRAMATASTLVKMAVGMLGSLSGASSMASTTSDVHTTAGDAK